MRAVGTAGYRTLGQYGRCVFSAKGAAFNHSLGQPRKLSGLKARFTADGHLFHQWNDARPTRLKRAFSACSVGNLYSWGDTPG